MALLFAGVTACSESGGSSSGPDDEQPAPDVPGAEWAVVAPEEHGIDPASLDTARTYAFADGMNTQAVVVVHDGAIVAEWYADGASADSWAASWSVAKSFTSALIGIAIEDELIPGVDEPMTTWFPEWEGTQREAITLRDVLQMSSGLDWVESYSPDAVGESDIIQMVLSEEDQLAYAASQPSANEPGAVWSYSSGDTMLLSAVIEQATGMAAHEYAQEEIFDAIGMEQVEWWRDARGHTLTYCCVDTTSRGFARFGLLYARQGAWGDEQVVPRAWVEDSLEPAPASQGAYGYQWWLDQPDDLPEDTFSARGHDGQYIYVIPSLDLVVVRNGGYVKDPGPPIAEPNLFAKYPSDGLVPGKGTINPERGWDDAEFLRPIVESLGGA
ncbi:MAG TPA: serine hydrolase [Acidimicrobiales bacterium]|nr:serine hydrolase [Acidimicrobiales bacterium]